MPMMTEKEIGRWLIDTKREIRKANDRIKKDLEKRLPFYAIPKQEYHHLDELHLQKRILQRILKLEVR